MTEPILDVIRRRAAAGSVPGRRDDEHVVSLAVEGGGMRGVVPAAMCAVLEAAGLIPAFDRIYGCSAGALTGCFTAAGQAVLWATTFDDVAGRELIDPARILRGRPVLDLGFLFETVIAKRKPLSAAGLARGPELRAVAVSAEDGTRRVLGGFRDTGELLDAVRVSCAIPLLGGVPPTFRGERMVDGGLVEPIPYVSALREGATHVLVLRSRPAAHRVRERSRVAELAVRRGGPALRAVVRESGALYNRHAAALEDLTRDTPSVMQIAVPDASRLVRRLETDPGRMAESLRLGAAAMASALYGEPTRVMWRPVPYVSEAAVDHPALDPGGADPALVVDGPAPDGMLAGFQPRLALP